MPLLPMWGAEPYSEETVRTSVPQAVHWNTPEMVTCLTRMWEPRWKCGMVGTDFTNGKTAASFEHGWHIQGIVKVKNLSWAIAPLPWAVTDSDTLWLPTLFARWVRNIKFTGADKS